MPFLFGKKKPAAPARARKKPSPAEIWKTATKNSQKHLKAGELGLYRNDLFSMADVHKAEGRRDEELRLLLFVCYLDFWPFGSLAEYRYNLEDGFPAVPGGIIAPGVITRISSAAKAIGYTPADVEQMFCREVRADMVPAPVMTVQGCAKLVRMSMEGKRAEAEKALSRETSKFVKANRR